MITKLTIVHRADVRAISSVVEDGKLEFLGEQRDFRRNELLAEFLSEDHGRLGMAWVKLGPGQVLEPHQHPIRSMILVCRGRGTLLANGEHPLVEGDAVLVPINYLHGFRGEGPDGVEGLSIQFEERGLYEDEHRPLVKFAPHDS